MHLLNCQTNLDIVLLGRYEPSSPPTNELHRETFYLLYRGHLFSERDALLRERDADPSGSNQRVVRAHQRHHRRPEPDPVGPSHARRVQAVRV